MHRLNISYKQFYVTLNEIWLFESDPNAPSTWSEPGGKQWQRSFRGRRNWDVELGPCAVIRHLCSVAFVWETKRPQADNSRSLIDRQVSCIIYISKVAERSCVTTWKSMTRIDRIAISRLLRRGKRTLMPRICFRDKISGIEISWWFGTIDQCVNVY